MRHSRISSRIAARASIAVVTIKNRNRRRKNPFLHAHQPQTSILPEGEKLGIIGRVRGGGAKYS